jgi:hypothetical protein
MGTYARQMAVISTIYDCYSAANFRPLGSAKAQKIDLIAFSLFFELANCEKVESHLEDLTFARSLARLTTSVRRCKTDIATEYADVGFLTDTVAKVFLRR